MARDNFVNSDSIYSKLLDSDTLIKNFTLLVYSFNRQCDYQVKGIDTSTNISDFIGYKLPVFLCDSNYYNLFNKEKDSIFNNLNKNNIVLKKTILRIDSFLAKNPHNFKFGYNNIKNSSWADSKTIDSWEELLESERIRVWKFCYETSQ